MNPYQSLTVTDKLTLILDGLARAVAACSDRRRPGGPMAVWLIRLIWTRVMRTQTRILALLRRFREGRLRVGSPARPVGRVREGQVGRRGTAVKGVPQRAEGKVPRRLAWLLPLVPCEAANFASQLRIALADPEMVALLMASPQARRILQPLCRMLGIEPAMLTPSGVAPPAPLVDPPEVAVAWNLGVVLRPGGRLAPPGDAGWQVAQGP